MYSVAQLKRGLRAPSLFLRELNYLYHTRLKTRDHNTAGVDLMTQDWDYLCLLDACRYDMFEDQSTLPGTLESRQSRGSNTVEFLQANLAGRELHDTVYVTANPQYRRHFDELDAEFHAVIDVWQDSGWNEVYNTVLPETTTEYALEAAREYPNKRLLVHYMQPHYPFIDDETDFDKRHLHNEMDDTIDFWHEIMFGQLALTPSDIWPLYRKTLAAALPHVEEFITTLEGKHVVTADHGNMVGERASPVPVTEWGHPRGIYTEELVKVPWQVYQWGDRPEITSEEPIDQATGVEDDTTMDRLRDLGYVQ